MHTMLLYYWVASLEWYIHITDYIKDNIEVDIILTCMQFLICENVCVYCSFSEAIRD